MKKLVLCLLVLLQTSTAYAVSSEYVTYIKKNNSRISTSRASNIVAAVEYYAPRYFGKHKDEGIKWVLSIMAQESAFRNVNGDDGASIGYMQIQIPTCNAARKFNGIKSQLNLHSLWSNVHCGMGEIHRLHSKLGGDWDRIIKAYNGGLASVLYPSRYKKANRMTDVYLKRIKAKRLRFDTL